MQFKPQKVLHLKDALTLKNPKITGEYVLTEKYNGWDTSIIFDGYRFLSPLSSAGRDIPAFEWVGENLNTKHISKMAPLVIKAEAYLPDTPFEELNGIFNRSKGNYTCKDVVFKVHDVVLPGQHLSAKERLVIKADLIRYLDFPYLHDVQPLLVSEYDEEKWREVFHAVAENGGEGIVAKRLNSYYAQGKRNADVLKLKLECTVDCLAVALEEGIGKKGNSSLTLISERKNGTKIRTVIGKHEYQNNFRQNPSRVIGKVVQIKGMYELPDGQIKEPVFSHIRWDKLITEID